MCKVSRRVLLLPRENNKLSTPCSCDFFAKYQGLITGFTKNKKGKEKGQLQKYVAALIHLSGRPNGILPFRTTYALATEGFLQIRYGLLLTAHHTRDPHGISGKFSIKRFFDQSRIIRENNQIRPFFNYISQHQQY